MVTKTELLPIIKKRGFVLYDEGGNLLKVFPLKITKTRRQDFWFDAIQDKDRKLHNYSNSFIYLSPEQATQGREEYVQKQIRFVTKLAVLQLAGKD